MPFSEHAISMMLAVLSGPRRRFWVDTSSTDSTRTAQLFEKVEPL